MGLGITVNGRFALLPQIIPILDSSELISSEQGAANILVLVGEATGLIKPKTFVAIDPTTGVLERTLVPGSTLLTAAKLAINASRDVPGVNQLRLITTNPAVQSDLSLDDSVAANVIDLKSNGWGVKFNDIKVQVDDTQKEVTITLDDAVEVFTYGTGAGALQALVDKINDKSGIVSATLVAAGNEDLATIAATNMANGSNGTTGAQDITDVFAELDQQIVDLVAFIDSSAVNQAQLVAHVEARRRIGFTGHALQTGWDNTGTRATNLSAIKAQAAGLNSKSVLYWGAGTDNLAAFIAVAKVAGIAAGTDPSVPLNNKDLNTTVVEVELSVAETEDLLDNGVSVYARKRNRTSPGFFVGDGMSSFSGNDNLFDRLISVRRGAFAMEKDIIDEIEQFLGAEGTEVPIGRVLSAVERRLERALRRDSSIRIANFDPSQISATFENTVLRVFYSFEPIQPIRFIVPIGSLKPTIIERTLEIPVGQ